MDNGKFGPPRISESHVGCGWEGSRCPVIVRGTTAEYRRTLRAIIRNDDLAIEIGSAAGTTTLELARRCRRAIGVDAASTEVEGALTKAENSGFSTTWRVTGEDGHNDGKRIPPGVEFVVARVKSGTECRASLRPLEEALERWDDGCGLRDVTVLAIDVAGTSPLDEVTPLVVSLREVMRPRVTVVKSLSLRKLFVALDAGENLAMDCMSPQKMDVCGQSA